MKEALKKAFYGVRVYLDFDGTLVSYETLKSPKYLAPTPRPLARQFISAVRSLASVVVVSHRPHDSLVELSNRFGFGFSPEELVSVPVGRTKSY